MSARTLALVALAAVTLAASACGADPPTDALGPSPTVTLTFDRVDVGGYRLAYECLGEGSPTIIGEAGYDTAGMGAFTGVLQSLAAITRVCTYDRAGIGNSDDRPKTPGLTSEDQAGELQTMLTTAGIGPPYVLVAHSYGGFIARLFAADHRDEVVGMVLIESSHEDEIGPYRRYYGTSSKGDWVDGGDQLDIAATARALRARARDFGSMPLITIRAERYEDVLSPALWRRTQADLATLSSDSIEVEALGSGHFVMDDNPPVVVTAARAVVEAVRIGGLASCAEIFASVAARCLQG